jgi:hypothetical protein
MIKPYSGWTKTTESDVSTIGSFKGTKLTNTELRHNRHDMKQSGQGVVGPSQG